MFEDKDHNQGLPDKANDGYLQHSLQLSRLSLQSGLFLSPAVVPVEV